MQTERSEQQPLDPQQLAGLIRSRRSINLFEPRAVDDDCLLEAIELARWAPNHRLTEPWRFYLLGPETAAAVARLAAGLERSRKGERAAEKRLTRLQGIPGTFVLTCRISDDPLLQQEDYAACCCAAQNLMLYLWNTGIGVKWTTGDITRESSFYEQLGIDSTAERVVGFFWYGYPKAVGTQKRRGLEEIVTALP